MKKLIEICHIIILVGFAIIVSVIAVVSFIAFVLTTPMGY